MEGFDKLDLSKVKSMYGMFGSCSSLKNIEDLANWDISNVTNLGLMFANCSSIESMDPLSNWNTENVTRVSNMFLNVGLDDIEFLRNWNTRNFNDISSLFANNPSLENITPLAKWNVSNVTLAPGVFSGCSSLKNVEPLKDWNLSNVTNISSMFYNCNNLESINALSNWRLDNVTDLSWMFTNCTSLKNLNALASWNVTNVTNMQYMVARCTNLESIDLTSWNTSLGDIYTTNGLFIDCNNLQSITLGENMIFSDNTDLPAIDTTNGDYTGEWVGVNTKTIYSDSDALTTEYDGSNPDTYIWRATPTYTVTYTFISGTDGITLPIDIINILPPQITGILDTELILSPTLSNTTITLPDGIWTFEGWDNASVTISSADAIVTGTWTYTPKYSVTYHSNTGNNETTYKVDNILDNDSHMILDLSDSALGYSRDGYTFKGWNTQADGMGSNHVAGESFLVQEHTHLYAQWEQIITPTSPSEEPIIAGASTNTVSNISTGDQTNTQDLITILITSLGLLSGLIITTKKKKQVTVNT
ncbi:MAG: BspA family leucine-rich repeat surface protein [Coprobacillaceae bacterium]